MAAQVSQSWNLIARAVTQVAARAKDRELSFGKHYQSVNALSYLWAWYFVALQWGSQRKLKERDKDALEKGLAQALDKYMDRWLICSQWARVWAASSATNLAKYASELANRGKDLVRISDVASTVAALAALMETNLKEIEQGAMDFLSRMNADDREQVRGYYTALWLWNRLDKTRWASAKVALRQKSGRKNSTIEVDHVVACDLWRTKLTSLSDEELASRVHEIGNCMLLEKNFNISKNNSTLKNFLDNVYEFKDKKLKLADWAAALDLDMAQVDCSAISVDQLQKLFEARTRNIRSDLENFVRGSANRIDLESGWVFAVIAGRNRSLICLL
jgi:hypothetical protein